MFVEETLFSVLFSLLNYLIYCTHSQAHMEPFDGRFIDTTGGLSFVFLNKIRIQVVILQLTV